MAKQATLAEKIKKSTVSDMQKLGTYKPEYLPIIEVYSHIREQYELLTEEYVALEYKHSEVTAAGGTKKSALVSTLETLRKDILTYSDRLCLNPKSMMEEKNKKQKHTSTLAKALSKLE